MAIDTNKYNTHEYSDSDIYGEARYVRELPDEGRHGASLYEKPLLLTKDSYGLHVAILLGAAFINNTFSSFFKNYQNNKIMKCALIGASALAQTSVLMQIPVIASYNPFVLFSSMCAFTAAGEYVRSKIITNNTLKDVFSIAPAAVVYGAAVLGNGFNPHLIVQEVEHAR